MEKLDIKSECEVIKIGDTPADLLSGFNAGCKGNIGVQSGAFTKEKLRECRHTHIIPSVRELPYLIKEEFQTYNATYL
ncbi:MAG: HAD hydrolase-like protein [Bacteroidales bacterium]